HSRTRASTGDGGAGTVHSATRRGDAQGGGRPGRHRGGRLRLDRDTGRAAHGGRDGQAAADGGVVGAAGGRPAGGDRRRVGRRTAIARRTRRPGPTHRLVPLPRTDGGGQDRTRQGPRRVPLRRRAGDGTYRHE